MRLAYLILAHNAPNHLNRLIRALDSPNAEFFIHIDRKSDILPFQYRISGHNVNFLKDRVAVYWSEFSIVEATINLIRTALNCVPNCDFLCLLSGSDYPLRDPHYIETYFARNRGHQFINIVRMPFDAVGKPIERLQQYRLQTPSKNRIIMRVVARVNRVINDQLKLVRRDYEKVLDRLLPYAGSQWWALTADAGRHILSFIDARPDVVKFFRHVYAPDESFFHTIIGNSEFSKHIVRNVTFADWSQPNGGPAVIGMDHLHRFLEASNLIEHSTYGQGELLFARKFTDDSSELTDFIDAYLIKRAKHGVTQS
jgi:hypothetical protein